MINKIQNWMINIFNTASGDSHRPNLSKNFESNIPGLFVVGDLAGAPVIKLAMAQGFDAIEYISSLPKIQSNEKGVFDIIIIGAGAAGLNAALAAKDKGFSTIVLEKEKMANTIENFPEGKWVYAEPDEKLAIGKLWLDGAQKEDLVNRWHQIVNKNNLDVRIEEPVLKIKKNKEIFEIETPKEKYKSHRIILATGQRGNPKKLGVQGEEQEHVYHRLYSPRKYKNEQILVVGGGNSAVETAITLSEQNKVILSYRRGEFEMVFKDNLKKLNELIASGSIEVIFNSDIKEFKKNSAILAVNKGGFDDQLEIKMNHAFVMIGAELPVNFLKSIGIRLENDWEGSFIRAIGLGISSLFGLWFAGGQTGLFPGSFQSMAAWIGVFLTLFSVGALITFGKKGDRWAWLFLSFLIWYTIYGIKIGDGREFWPFTDWGYEALKFAGRPWSFWYTVIYTGLMTVFGIQALKR